MVSKTKKVILIIVEGIEDQVSLEAVVSKLIVDSSVKFAITRGDITTDRAVTSQNIKKKLSGVVNFFLSSSRLTKSDILRIIHIVDTDGAFIPDDCVVENPNERLLYLSDCIETQNPQGIKDRNGKKARILRMLIATPEISNKKYDVYFFSRNLEHVLHDKDQGLTSEEKTNLADEFADHYHDKPQEFLSFISDPAIAVQGTKAETWDFIKEGTNSLGRYSNVHVFLQDLIKEL